VNLLTWNHACPVGVRALDDQHGILMDALNNLHLAMVRGSGRAEARELLNRLVQLTNMHILSEERLMELYNFPSLEAHRAEHVHLLSVIRQSAVRMQHGEEIGMRPLLTQLRDLYTEHIEGHDSLYGPWLNDHGIY
jgi:hemerythrin